MALCRYARYFTAAAADECMSTCEALCGEGEVSIELSWEEVKLAIEGVGFQIMVFASLTTLV